MSEQIDNRRALEDWSQEMKRDWDDRARRDPKWFIHPLRFQQTDDEFDNSGARAVAQFVVDDLDLLARGRDPFSLRVLELGCGIGRMTRFLAGAFAEVYATDVSAEMILLARSRLQDLSNVNLLETSGYDFAELPSEYFDLVFSAFVFQHVPSTEIICSNLRDAYRVLKTGGCFKFQTNSITAFAFEEIEKDTWMGASLPESEIRRFAEEVGAQLISLEGRGSQSCWTILKKQPVQIDLAATLRRPAIEFHGRTDLPTQKQIPINGEHCALTLLVSGFDSDAVDCNSVCIDVWGLELLPHYVGPLRKSLAALSPLPSAAAMGRLTQIDLSPPVGAPSGAAEVRVRLTSGEVSQPIRVDFVSPEPVVPRISSVMNAVDNGADVRVRGAKSHLRIHVEGLDETADTGNIRVQVAGRIVKPSFVGSLPGKQLYRVEAQLPQDIPKGPTELCLYFGNIQSPTAQLEVLDEES